MNKEIRYRNAREHFLQIVRLNGDGTAQTEALEEYKEASDEYHKLTMSLGIIRRCMESRKPKDIIDNVTTR